MFKVIRRFLLSFAIMASLRAFEKMHVLGGEFMRILVILSLILFGGAVLAGAGQHDPLTKAGAIKKASTKLAGLIKKGKLDQSWSEIKVKNVEKKTFSKGPEWVVSFYNGKVTDKSRQTLYMFYDMDGHYLAANFTGN